jgi:NADH-quinone oxidoreductase subunit K
MWEASLLFFFGFRVCFGFRHSDFGFAEEGRLMVDVGLEHYLIIGAVLFVCGALCMATKRNAIGVLIGVELVLNGANINFVAFAHFNPAFEIEGMVFALFVIVLAAAEAAVALAIVLNFYNNHMSVDVDSAEELKG